MSRAPLIVANWKMYKTSKEAHEFIHALTQEIHPGRRVFIAPPFTAIAASSLAAAGSQISIGAQNMHDQWEGAFTGEVSALMLKDLEATFVILGHSERRQQWGETDALINKKIHLALKQQLLPILCIGELLKERKENNHIQILKHQLQVCLEGLTASQVASLIIAYEPIWAIGTGQTATAEVAQETHLIIRSFLEEAFGLDCSRKACLLYGGSVKPDNIASLMAQTDIDGVLVGGASLDLRSFINIVNF